MAAYDDVVAELAAEADRLAPVLEGLADFGRLNLTAEAKKAITEEQARFQRRKTLVDAARQALLALLADGYPVPFEREVIETVFADLKGNVETIAAAFAVFTQPRATEARVTASEPEPKG